MSFTILSFLTSKLLDNSDTLPVIYLWDIIPVTLFGSYLAPLFDARACTTPSSFTAVAITAERLGCAPLSFIPESGYVGREVLRRSCPF